MNAHAAPLVLIAYLIGSIPFGYLTGKWFRGVDVRTIGSGNIGATNVGRILGFRFFVLVFTLDLAKGLLPTLLFPEHFASWNHHPAPGSLAVFVALATILGHNFPVYLKFKGGKGVATSLGALLALDPTAAGASALSSAVFLVVCRYVSLSSIGGGFVFFLVHFARVAKPWSPEERAMSVLTVALLILLLVRHRKNFARIVAGTEPKVPLGRRRTPPPSGRIGAAGVLVLALVVAAAVVGGIVARRSATHEVFRLGGCTLREVAHAATGHQRADRVAFADGGRLLAVTCPRYDRVVIYRVTATDGLETDHDIEIGGQPVAICAADDRFLVLARPSGDRRHVEPGWWQSYDFQGRPFGERVQVGYYPDDMALTADGRFVVVLTSGRAEGSADRGAPSLTLYGRADARPVGRIEFDGPTDDPTRLTLSATGKSAVVTLAHAHAAAAVDLSDGAQPRLAGRSTLDEVSRPYLSRDADDAIVMPSADGHEALLLNVGDTRDCLVVALPRGSALEFLLADRKVRLGALKLHAGAFGLGSTRPTGLAYSPARGLIAVANRSGGVHLVAVHAGPGPDLRVTRAGD